MMILSGRAKDGAVDARAGHKLQWLILLRISITND